MNDPSKYNNIKINVYTTATVQLMTLLNLYLLQSAVNHISKYVHHCYCAINGHSKCIHLFLHNIYSTKTHNFDI